MSTHVWSVQSLSRGPWNCAIYARHTTDMVSPNFQGYECFIWATKRWKVLRKRNLTRLSADVRPSKIFVWEHKVVSWTDRSSRVHQFVTRSCELDIHIVLLLCHHPEMSTNTSFQNLRLGVISLPIPNDGFGRMNKRWHADFRVLFKGVSTQFGPRTVEKCFLRNHHFIFCSSFQNRRLGVISYF